MAGLQMPKRGDGAAMLRDLRDKERPPLEAEGLPSEAERALPDEPANEAAVQDSNQSTNEHIPALTEARTYGSTGAIAEVSTAGSKDALTDAGTEGRRPARRQGRMEGSKEGKKDARTHTREEGTVDFLEAVDAALASREPLVGGVKATVDMSPELSTRSKRYLADHRGQNTRQVLIALFDAYLSAKGY